MRIDACEPKSAKAGDLIVIRLATTKRVSRARFGVWSRVKGWDFAPHVPPQRLGVVKDGRPQMVQPLFVQLHEQASEHVYEFVAEEDLEFVVRQEVDVPSDPIAYARIRRYGTIAQALRRCLRNAVRSLRHRTPREERISQRS